MRSICCATPFRSLPEPDRQPISDQIKTILSKLTETRQTPQDWRSALEDITTHEWRQIRVLVDTALASAPAAEPRETYLWLERTDHHLSNMRRDLDTLQPWRTLTDNPPAGLGPLSELLELLPAPDTPMDQMADRIGQGAPHACTTCTTRSRESCLGFAGHGKLSRAGRRRSAISAKASCSALQRAEARAFGMDFRPLYDTETRTFFIGYNLGTDQIDQHHYDLLASEARLASYFAIAKRDVPVEHWFHLGRPITQAGGTLATLSWNGSMFEYLMPALLLPSDAGRLLGQSERGGCYRAEALRR